MEDSEARFRNADQEGDAAAATQLGIALKEKGDSSGALAAFQRADERSDGMGASMVPPLPGEHPISLENRRAALRRI